MQSFSRGWSFLKQAWQMAVKDKDLIKPSIMALFAGFIVSIIFIPLMVGAGFLTGGDNSLVGQVALFMLNRDTTAERDVTIAWQSPTPSKVLACQTLTGRDLKALNTFDQPSNVAPRILDAPQASSSMTFRLPAGSYTVAHLATSN